MLTYGVAFWGREMKWTVKLPTKEGWYWVDGIAGDKSCVCIPSIVEVFMFRRFTNKPDPGDGLCVRIAGEENETPLELHRYSWWYGPLAHPPFTKRVLSE